MLLLVSHLIARNNKNNYQKCPRMHAGEVRGRNKKNENETTEMKNINAYQHSMPPQHKPG